MFFRISQFSKLSFFIRVLMVVIPIAGILFFAAAVSAQTGKIEASFRRNTASTPIPGQYIVVLKKNTGTPAAAAFSKGTNVKEKKYKTKHIYSKTLNGFSASLTQEEVNTLKADTSVEYVVPDRVVAVAAVPGQEIPLGIKRINAANNTKNKGTGVNVAVIDTGIDVNHPDLAANIVGGID